ncbi:MAG: ABC transporter ATP-binding protein/permease [Bacilli bacterium]|jgi:ATP-binding cassette subfamily B protein|nr:ABC transporter ATP-binding protein/permease [Bacilli bacterium]MCH4210255.1 ABC transporter ATP-binding protein/permease [Bacilli bacterium]MCH4228558.1 ABC transporter ATP-binding protein/permease [Bacilli bacterium]MCH4277306.1 ABC transporter ATP-binding protein/permease [Bacilli bacterium]MCI2055346.1 ABC transporter ATP-binding protein/permease [Bacilli bacterium]
MKKLLSTCHRLIKGHELVYYLSLVAQVLMIFSQVFSTFLIKVLTDTLNSTAQIEQGMLIANTDIGKAQYVESWVVYVITAGRGTQFLLDNKVLVLVTALLVTAVISALCSLLRMGLRAYVAAIINGSMQLVVFNHLERLPYSYYKKNKSGDLIQTCTRDLDVIRKFLIGDASNFNYTFWMVVLCFSILMSISSTLTLVSLSLFPLMFIYSFLLIKEVRKRYRATDDSEARMTDKISENLAAVRIVKAFNAEQYEISSFKNYLDDYQVKFLSWRKMSAFFFSSSDVFVFGSKVLSLCFGIYLCYTGEINSGTLVLSFLFVNMMVWPLRDVATSLSNMGQYIASSDRILLILDEPIEDVSTGLTPAIKGDIVFDHAGFKYDDADSEVIHDISFSVKAGSTVAIMGKTGSGKSTLSLLLTRLYDYTSGSIKVDGVELKDIQKSYLRRNIVPVLQDPFLFSKSISQNILMANKKASKDEVIRAARIASVHDTIMNFKEGYDTPVGEKGMSLSGGQKQRVAIARTIISNAPVIIFDDSLSAVDTETDLAIRQNLKELEQGTTTFIVTHRVSTARDADLIVVLEDGRVSEMGTHDELIKKPGLYQRVNDIQSKMA